MSLHDDPRLTAYALGELDGAEAAEVEALLADDPAARAALDEIRAVAALLETELGATPNFAPDEALRAVVVDGPERRAWPWAVGGTVAAAAAAALFVVGPMAEDPTPPVPSRQTASTAPAAPASAAVAAKTKTPVDPNMINPAIRPDGSWAKAPMYETPKLSLESGDSRNRGRAVGRRKNRNAMKALSMDSKLFDPHPTASPLPRSAASAAPRSVAMVARSAPASGAVAFQWDFNGDTGLDALAANEYAYRYRQGDLAGAHRVAATESMGRDRFDAHPENPFTRPAGEKALSTFSIDVDTASYSMTRSMLSRGRRPPPGAVRIEELLNYFEYSYAPPKDDVPFATHIEVTAAPWAPAHRLVRVGLKGKMIDRPTANLVFLIDVSGSMSAHNKLPLLKRSMKTLVDALNPDDRVAIVVYAGAAGLVLPSTPAREKRTILNALDRLQSGGSTNGGAGIHQAYKVAQDNFILGGVNRVIIGTDGDFNVGTTSRDALVEMVELRARLGIALTVLGFGMGNYNDATLEQLADKGDGNYAYIDTPEEGRKVLVDQLEGTLVTIAKDVKIQVEFNPNTVEAYRLIGYENRTMAARDFNDDTKDAGEIGAGHAVTALYEVVPTDYAGRPGAEPLKYQKRPTPPPGSDELLTLKLRYKAPSGGKSKLLSTPLVDSGNSFAEASVDLRFAASVAAFGMILRGSPHVGKASLSQVLSWAEGALGDDAWGYRRGFLTLVSAAQRVVR